MSEPTIGTIKGSREDFSSMLGEGFHTAFRKGTDTKYSQSPLLRKET